jgi:hypothetical protein
LPVFDLENKVKKGKVTEVQKHTRLSGFYKNGAQAHNH